MDNMTMELRHAGEMLAELAQLRQDGQYCDILLKVENEASGSSEAASEASGVWAHRAVLAAASPVFYKMFYNNLDTCTKQIIYLKGVELEILRALVDNIYSAAPLTVNVVKATAVLEAATMLEVVDVREAASDCLACLLVADNALSIHATGKRYKSTALSTAASEYIDKHFEYVVQGVEFLALGIDELIMLLNRDRPPTIENILDAVLRWTQHCPQERERHLMSLLQTIQARPKRRAPTDCGVQSTELLQVAEELPTAHTQPKRRALTATAMQSAGLLHVAEAPSADRHTAVANAYIQSSPQLQQSHAALLVMGGWRMYSDRFEMDFGQYCIDSVVICPLPGGPWQAAASLPASRSHAGAALLDGLVYLVGGYDGCSSVETVFVYDVAKNSWSIRRKMTTPRKNLGVAALAGQVYAVGGVDDDRILNSVEAMDPREGMWRLVAPMGTPRSELGVAVLSEKLYAVGGSKTLFGIGRSDENSILDSVERYDPRADAWEAVESMRQKRERVAVGVLDDEIYAMGGWDRSSLIRSVERYRAGSGWRRGPSLPSGRSDAAAAVHGSRLYVIGGCDDISDLSDPNFSSVSVFDPDTAMWSELPNSDNNNTLIGNSLYIRCGSPAAVVIPWTPTTPQT